MEELDFAASILGTTPEELDTYEESETLTNEEETSEDQAQNPKEESRTSEEEPSELEQEKESETTEEEDSYISKTKSSRKARAERFARLRAEREEAQSNNFVTNNELDEDGSLTYEQLEQLIESKALNLLEQREIQNLQNQIQEDWVDDVQETIKSYPELNPESKEYNKELDDLLTQTITNPDGSIRFDVQISDMVDKIMAIQKRAAIAYSQQSKIKLDRQTDESAISGGIQSDNQPSKRSLDDMSFQDIVAAAEKGEFS